MDLSLIQKDILITLITLYHQYSAPIKGEYIAEVIQRNPDYIVTSTIYFGDGVTPVDEILAREGWADIAAVHNAAILNLPNYELTRPGPRLADGAQLLNDFISESLAAVPAA